MVVNVRSLGLTGLSGYEVNVECFLSGGLPAFDVVGLPDAAVREARERVRAAVKNCGGKFPVSRITVNLAPANQRKEGTVYDLPIALGILCAAEELPALPEDAAFIGELSLSGLVRGVYGVLPMALHASRCGIRKLFVPAENAAEATLADGVEVYGVETLDQLMAHLRGDCPIAPAAGGRCADHHPRVRLADTAQPFYAGVCYESLPLRLVRSPLGALHLLGRAGGELYAPHLRTASRPH